MTTTIDMIRHGEPVGGRKYRGQIDDPLSDKGWQQMRDAVADHCPWDSIISSPLLRCADFANELAERHKLAVSFAPEFMEIGFGSWEGKTANEIQQQTPGALEAFWRDPVNNRPDGAEPLVEFRKRIESAWVKLLSLHTDQHILIVCHAGVIRMSLQYILGMPIENVFRIKVSNAGLTRILVDQGNDQTELYPQLIFHDGKL
jgi:alpha-ribazole phosphatase